MPKTSTKQTIDENYYFGQSAGLLKLLSVVKEFGNQWKSGLEMSFKKYIVNQMNVMVDCGEFESQYYYDLAVMYGFLVKKVVSDDTKSCLSYVLCDDKSKLSSDHDWFCFDCDKLVDEKSSQYQKCQHCWRVFHKKCPEGYRTPQKYIINNDKCGYCLQLDNESAGFIGEQKADSKRLNKLIIYLLNFVKTQMKDNYSKLLINDSPECQLVVYKPMDLSIMRQKAIEIQYNKLIEFENDFYIFMHNISITTIDFHLIEQVFEDFKLFYKKEISELRLCVDCYDKSNDKLYQQNNVYWFCDPCQPPHKLLFVKTKNYPYYPAKYLKELEDGKYQVRFFDKQLRRMDVRPTDCRPITDQIINNSLKNNKRVQEPMKMLDRYMDNLKNLNKKTINVKLNKTADKINDNLINNEISTELSHISIGNKTPVDPITETIDKVINSSNKTGIKAKVRKSPRNRSKDGIQTDRKRIGLRSKSIIIKKGKTKAPISLFDSTEVFANKSLIDSPVWVPKQNCVVKPVIIEKSKSCQNLFNQKPNQSNSNFNVEEPKFHENIEIINEVRNDSAMDIDNSVVTDNSDEQKVDKETDDEVVNKTNETFNTNLDKVVNSSHLASTSQSVPQQESSDQNLSPEKEKIPESVFKSSPKSPKETSGTASPKDIKLNPSLLNQFNNENANKFNKLFDELMNSVDSIDIQQKLICIKFYHDKHVKSLEQRSGDNRDESTQKDLQIIKLNEDLIATKAELTQTKLQLFEAKTKNWCAICQKSATFYCCLRFYCSVDCQRIDWRTGHSQQCLCLKANQ